MTTRRWWIGGGIVALALGVLLLLRAWITPIHVAAPEPSVTADLPDTLQQTQRSVVIAPIVFDLAPAIARFETDVPRRFGSMDRRLRADSTSRTSVAFTATRSPFRVRVEGAEIIIETVLEYEGRGWYKPPIGPEVSAGCGGGENPKPRLLVRIVSTPSLTPQWGLRTQTRAEVTRFSEEPRDECHVSVLKIDVTDKVVAAAGEEMTRLLARLDRHVARVDLRERIESIWRTMEGPIRLTDGVWLLIRPSAARLESLGGGGDSLVAVVRLEVRPKIVSGLRPQERPLLTPLPPLGEATDRADGEGAEALSGREFRIVLEGIFSYDTATALMRKALLGKAIRVVGRRVRIEDVTLSGIGSGRVALGVTFSGGVQGRLFLTGTPRLDLVRRQLAVPDLDFDIGSTDLLTHGLSRWRGDAVRDFLRAKAIIPDSAALGGVERLAEHGMNRELTSGVRLEATLGGARGVAVSATREHLIVRALAGGQARLAIDRVLVRAVRRSNHHHEEPHS